MKRRPKVPSDSSFSPSFSRIGRSICPRRHDVIDGIPYEASKPKVSMILGFQSTGYFRGARRFSISPSLRSTARTIACGVARRGSKRGDELVSSSSSSSSSSSTSSLSTDLLVDSRIEKELKENVSMFEREEGGRYFSSPLASPHHLSSSSSRRASSRRGAPRLFVPSVLVLVPRR